MNRTQEIIEQTLVLRKAGFETTQAVADVFKLARQLHRIHERQCNGYPCLVLNGATGATEHGEDTNAAERDNRREQRVKNRLVDLFNQSAPVAYVEFQGDPRGAPLIIYGKDEQELGRVWG